MLGGFSGLAGILVTAGKLTAEEARQLAFDAIGAMPHHLSR